MMVKAEASESGPKFKQGDTVTDCMQIPMEVKAGPFSTEDGTVSYLCEDEEGVHHLIKEPLLQLRVFQPIAVDQVWRSTSKAGHTAEIIGGPFDERGHEVWVFRMANGALSLTGEKHLHSYYVLDVKPVRRAKRSASTRGDA